MPATAVKLQSTAELETEPLSILVAEDSEITSDLLKLLLTRRGHAVVCVGDGEAALNELSSNTYDVCLIDFHLPKMNGLEAVRTFRENGKPGVKPILFIGMTADVEGLLAHRANCEILDMVFGKPIVANDLFEAVEQVGRHHDSAAPGGTGFGNVEAFRVRKGDANLIAVPKQAGSNRSESASDPVPDRRGAVRRVVSLSGTTIKQSNGEEHNCRIVSLSTLGAGIETSFWPQIGECVVVGRTKARVVRVEANCIGVEFTRTD